MNRIDRLFGLKGEARVRYKDGDFQIVSAGDYVKCAVTGQNIPLQSLRYWSVDLQEAYATSQVAFERYRELRARGELPKT